MNPKKGLGKGLKALIPHADENDNYAKHIAVPINEIILNPYQPRKSFNQEKLEELSASIQEYGVIQPLVVTKEDEKYVLISGERRLRAATMAGLAVVPVVLREADETEKLQIAMIENLQREDLNPLEEARGFALLADRFTLTHEEIAQKISKSRAYISNSLRLLSLSPEIQKNLEEGKITVGQARPLLAIKEAEAQKQLAAKIIKEKKTARQVEEEIAEIRKKSETENKQGNSIKDYNYNIARLQEKMQIFFGTKVRIYNKQHSQKGRLEIEFYGEDDLDRLCRHILGDNYLD